MKTYLFLRNKTYRPSTYYRIYQYIENDLNKNIELSEYEADQYYTKKTRNKLLRGFIILYFGFILGYLKRIIFLLKINKDEKYKVFVQREIFPRFVGPFGRYLLNKVLVRAHQVYWDFDDNILDSKEITGFEKNLLYRYTTKISVGNQFLKDKIDQKYTNKVLIINTTDKMMADIDVAKINVNRLNEYSNKVVLIWVGTKINLKYLESIIPELDLAAKELKHKKIILRIVSNGKLEIKTENLIIENIEWERSVAFKEMLNAHIGLMPLKNDEITKGKCAFKAVQSIGCGLPIIVSNVGMNKEVVKENGYLINEKSEWTQSIINLGLNKEIWEKSSINSRELWEAKFSSQKISDSIRDMLF